MMTRSGGLNRFFEFVYESSGYDFRNYSQASLQRRVETFCIRHRFADIDDLRRTLEKESGLMREFVEGMTVQVTEMFRDPPFFLQVRDLVIETLKTYPRIKIWHAGCSNGAEVYSMAILLHEAGLLERSRIYASDINELALRQAKTGVYDIRDMQLFIKNYQESGGRRDFADYYRADSQSVIISPMLKERVTFSFHNLATDWVFTEAHLIVCRNVLIYFDRKLQDRAFDLFEKSLVRRGFLGLGSKESLRFSSVVNRFETVDGANRIFRLKD